MPTSSLNPLNIFSRFSLQAKLMTVLLVSVIIPLIVIGSFSYSKAVTSYEDAAISGDQEHVLLVTSQVTNTLKQIPDDLVFLHDFHDLKRYLLWHDIGEKQVADRWLTNTVNAFRSFMQSNEMYMQLRVLDAEGWEILRINRDRDSNVSITRKQDLQRKHESSYFKKTMSLNANEFYVSQLNLNREHGKIQIPHTPVIRYALPLIDERNVRHGIIIINVFAEQFLDAVLQMTGADDQEGDVLYVANKDGFFLAHPVDDKTFGFDLDHEAGLVSEHAELWQATKEADAGFLFTDQKAYAYNKIYPLTQNKTHYWYVVHSIPRNMLLAELSSFQQIFVVIMIFLLLLIILCSRPLIRMLVHPVQLVTRNMQQLERGECSNLKTIDYNGHDEISTMVDVANGLSQRIAGAIAEANNIAQGDYRSDIKPQSDKDELGIALQAMTLTLRDVTNIVEAIAVGDLSRDIAIKSNDDLLGAALKQMITTLRDTIGQANLIAQGDYRSDINVRSEQDKLGISLQQMTLTLRDISQVAAAVATGDFSSPVNIKGEFDQLGNAMAHMTQVLKANADHDERQNWLKGSVADTAHLLQNQPDSRALANNVMQQLPETLQASHGAFYVMRDDTSEAGTALTLEASYAFRQRKNISNHFKLGEGLIGQCGLEQRSIVLTQVPDDYIKIESGLGESSPNQIIVVPLLAESQLMGVLELATTGEFSPIQVSFLEQINDSIGMALYALQSTRRTNELLQASQSMTETLQAQQEELREANLTLETRAEELSASEEELKAQQEEMRLKNDQLTLQNNTVEAQKKDLTASAKSLAIKAEELQQASQYKSDFLSNMSHELRTPLNSLLILSDMLAKNKDGNLTDKQVEFASTIHGSGADLLELINSILDLAKVEAGKMELDPHRFPLHDITDAMQRGFAHMAEKKGVNFRIEYSDKVPEVMFSDAMRIKQVIKNLLSNALKFTDAGEMLLRLERIDETQISFAVIDSGVGIAADKMNAVFEAFQQEDGSTSRKYGGTGLGLSICRELSKLLGGHITVQSEQNKGSTFALIIPIECAEQSKGNSETITLRHEASKKENNTEKTIPDDPKNTNIAVEQTPNPLNDDRDNIGSKDQTILIIEDDKSFASIQQGLVQEHGFKAINALRGDHGLMLAQQYMPDAILLDLQLPVLDGMSLLDRLKQHPRLRHIPVHVISCMDKTTEKRVLQAGAISFIHKPASQDDIKHVLDEITTFIQRDIKRLLIVEDDDKQREAMTALLEANNVKILSATTGAASLDILRNDHVDCMILDLSLPDMSGEDVLAVIEQEGDDINQGHVLPIIVHTGRDLSEGEVKILQGISKSIIIKGSYSPDRLLAETSLFLHQIEDQMSDDKQDRIDRVRQKDVDLHGKTVLLVDDDIRNIYSLSSYLEGYGLTVVTARNGIEGLTGLKEHADAVDLILMDIMMPEMNGYECMQKIRKIKEHQNLPIIALTAKAMKGDREQCIAAGASDYITKPVDTNKLLSLIRVWLHE